MEKNRIRTLHHVICAAAFLALLFSSGTPADAQPPDQDLEGWIEARAEQGESHASGGQPELGPQLIGNPTTAVKIMRIGLRYSFTPAGAFSEFASFHHPFVRLSNTADSVHVLDLSTGKQIAVMEPGMVFEVSYDQDAAAYVVAGPSGTIGAYAGPVYFRPSGRDNLFHVESIRRVNVGTVPRYRGAIEVARGTGTATPAGMVNVVNILDLENYVRGVVTNESPASFHVEALKAQATAARGYAVSNVGRFVRQGLPFDLDDSTASQVYRGVVSEHPRGDQAVEETRSLVASYRGRIISALYSSSMGGHTENNEWIFNFPSTQFPGANAEPYLRGIYDGEGAPPDLGSDDAVAQFWKNAQPQTFDECTRVRNRFARWRITIPAAAIKARLTAGRFVLESGTIAGQVTGVEVVQRMAASRRIGVARVRLTTGSVLVRGWENVRRVLGTTAAATPDCRNTTIAANFVLNNPSVIEPFFNTNGTFGGVIAHGGGWGHNVGMSQFGAHGRGLAGQNFIQILKGYYTGVDVGSYPIDIGREPGSGAPTLRQEFAAPTGRGTLEIRPEGLKGLRVHINETHDLTFTEADLASGVVRVDITTYLQLGPNLIQYNPVGRNGSATVLVIVE